MHFVPENFFHIIIRIGQCENCGIPSPFFIDRIDCPRHAPLLFFKLCPVVVADDIADARVLAVALHVGQVEKSLVPLGHGGNLVCRQKCVDLTGKQCRVDHLPFRIARMDGTPGDNDVSGSRVEVFIFDAAKRAAVHGVCKIRAESRDVELVSTPPDLLIRRECDLHASVRDIGFQKSFRRAHNFGDTRFVVRAEQGRAVRDDEVLAAVFYHTGVIPLGEDDVLLRVQDDFLAVIQHFSCLDRCIRARIGGIHVCDQTDDGAFFRRICGNCRPYIAVFVTVRSDAKCGQLLCQILRKRKLFLCARTGFRRLVGHGRIGDVGEKSLFYSHVLWILSL